MFKPLPKLHSESQLVSVPRDRTYPVTSLPEMKWPRLNAEHCIAAPTTMIAEPRKMVLLRPRISPNHIVVTAPQKHPTL